jgi:hypothetical protein
LNSIRTLSHPAFAPPARRADQHPLHRLSAAVTAVVRIVAFLPRTALAMERVRLLLEEERRLEHRHPLRAARLRREIQEIFEAIA